MPKNIKDEKTCESEKKNKKTVPAQLRTTAKKVRHCVTEVKAKSPKPKNRASPVGRYHQFKMDPKKTQEPKKQTNKVKQLTPDQPVLAQLLQMEPKETAKPKTTLGKKKFIVQEVPPPEEEAMSVFFAPTVMDKEISVSDKTKKEHKKRETSPKTNSPSSPKNEEIKKAVKPKVELKPTLPKVKAKESPATSPLPTLATAKGTIETYMKPAVKAPTNSPSPSPPESPSESISPPPSPPSPIITLAQNPPQEITTNQPSTSPSPPPPPPSPTISPTIPPKKMPSIMLKKLKAITTEEDQKAKVAATEEVNVYKSSPMLQDIFSPVSRMQRLMQLERLHSAIREQNMEEIQFICKEPDFNINDVLCGVCALSQAVISSGDVRLIHFLLHKGSEVQDAHLFAVLHDRRVALELLLETLNTKHGPTAEYRVVGSSYRFPPYATPIMIAAMNGNRYLLSFLRNRKHELQRPHRPACTCQRCKKALEFLPRFLHFRQLTDTYIALTNPAYLNQTEHNVLATCFFHGRSLQLLQQTPAAIGPWFDEFGRLITQLQTYATSLVQLVRNPKQMQFLLQSDVEDYHNNLLEYPLLQCAIELRWNVFLNENSIQEFRTCEWLNSASLGMWLPLKAPGRLLLHLINSRQSRPRLSPQTKHVLNSTICTFLCLFQLWISQWENGNERSKTKQVHRMHWIFVLMHFWASLSWLSVIKKRAKQLNNWKLPHFYPGHCLHNCITLLYLICSVLSLIQIHQNRHSDQKTSATSKVPALHHHFPYSDHQELDYILHLCLRLLISMQLLHLFLVGSCRAFNSTISSSKNQIINSCLYSFNVYFCCSVCVWLLLFFDLYRKFIPAIIIRHFDQSSGAIQMNLLVLINLLIIYYHEMNYFFEFIPNTNFSYFWNCYFADLLHGFTENPFLFNIFELVTKPLRKGYVKYSHEDEIDYIMFSLINRWDAQRGDVDPEPKLI